MTSTDDKTLQNGTHSSPASAPPNVEEERLWQKVLENPADDNLHKAYFSYALHNGFMKEASRRYGLMVNEKDKFTVDERRQFRKYQQTIVNLMFMGSPRDLPPAKGRSADAFIYILAALLIVAGLMVPVLRVAFFIGIAVIGVMVFFKYRAIKNASKEHQRLPE